PRTMPAKLADHVADVVALIDALGVAPVTLVANSSGGLIALETAVTHPEVVQRIALHEPPAVGLLAAPSADLPAGHADDPMDVVKRHLEAGESAQAVERFMELTAPGKWARMPEASRQRMIGNAPTFLDELHDPEEFRPDPARL